MNTERLEGGKRRVKKATLFFDRSLLPAIQRGEEVAAEVLKDMMEQFQGENPGMGSDFTLDQVWGAAFVRYAHLVEIADTNPSELPGYTPSVVKAFELLTDMELSGEYF